MCTLLYPVVLLLSFKGAVLRVVILAVTGQTFCVAELCGGEQPAPVLGVLDVELDQMFLLQVQQVVHSLVAVQQQRRGVLLQQQQSPFTAVVCTN